MQNSTIKKKERISKKKGFFMVLVAICIDLLPFLVLVIAGLIMVSAYADSFLVQETALSYEKRENYCELVHQYAWTWRADLYLKYATLCLNETAALGIVGGVTVGVGVAGALAGLILFGPIIYTILSIVGTIFGYLLFIFWFAFNGVNIISFSRPKKLLYTSVSGFIELIPLLNMLPGVSVMVFLNLREVRKEDDEVFMEQVNSMKSLKR